MNWWPSSSRSPHRYATRSFARCCAPSSATPSSSSGSRGAPARSRTITRTSSGLIEHTVAVAGMCRTLAEQYPQADADVLLCAALLHDIGKCDELTFDTAIEYTDQGRLARARRAWRAASAGRHHARAPQDRPRPSHASRARDALAPRRARVGVAQAPVDVRGASSASRRQSGCEGGRLRRRCSAGRLGSRSRGPTRATCSAARSTRPAPPRTIAATPPRRTRSTVG